jgi:hypothetical protein
LVVVGWQLCTYVLIIIAEYRGQFLEFHDHHVKVPCKDRVPRRKKTSGFPLQETIRSSAVQSVEYQTKSVSVQIYIYQRCVAK